MVTQIEDMDQQLQKISLTETIFFLVIESQFQEMKQTQVWEIMFRYLKSHIQVSGLMMMSTTISELFQVKPTEAMHQNSQRNSLKEITSFQVIESQFQEMNIGSQLKTMLICLPKKSHTQEYGDMMMSIVMLEHFLAKQIEDMALNFQVSISLEITFFQDIELLSQEMNLTLVTTLLDLLKLNQL